MYVMLCLMIGLMYVGLGDELDYSGINSRTSMLFFCAAFLVFMSVAVLPFFMMERPTFLRERTNGAYGVGAWVLANFLCSLPGLALISILSTVCVVPLAGLNGFGVFFAALLCSLIAAEGFMNLIGAISPHYIIGIALGAGVYGFFMLCEGALKVQDDIPPWFIWVHHIGFHTYSYRVFMYNEFHTIKQFDAGAPFASGMELLKFYSFDTVDVSRPPPQHHTPLPRHTPLPCYIPLLGGPRPRRPHRLRHLLPRLLRPRPVLLPHRTSLRAGEEGGGVDAPGEEEERDGVGPMLNGGSCGYHPSRSTGTVFRRPPSTGACEVAALDAQLQVSRRVWARRPKIMMARRPRTRIQSPRSSRPTSSVTQSASS